MKKTVMLLLAAMFSISVLAQGTRYAVTDLSVCYLRQSPDYESPLETQELMGVVVEVLAKEGYWVQVNDPQPYVAWVTDHAIVEMTAAEIEEYKAAPKYIVTDMFGKIYSQPTTASQPVSDLVMGDLVRKVLVNGKPVRSRNFLKVMTPSGKTGYVLRSALRDQAEFDASRTRDAASVVALARRFVGTPYMWGGMSPKGFDCSGLMRISYLMNGIVLPRNASQQVKCGVEAPLDSLLPGDLLFFGRKNPDGSDRVTHVGMYIGNNHFIHSSHLVRINSMRPEDPDCYENISRLLCARRIIHD